MPTYTIVDFSSTTVKLTVDLDEYVYKKAYCSTAVFGYYLYFYAHQVEQNYFRQQWAIDYNDCTNPVAASASALKTAVDAILNNYAVPTGGYVPYVGATTNVDLGANGLITDFVSFDLTPVAAPGAGQIAYQGNTGALSYLLNNSNVMCSIGQTMHAYVHNGEAVTITKGQAVYLFSASGNKASVKLANNTSDATSAKTFGLAAEDIGAGQNGMVICQGVIDGLNTSMYTAGDTLYLGNTAGSYTNVKPYAPNHFVYIGIVEKANAGNGQIYVRVQNGYEMDEIHDVDLITTPPVANNVLTYNGTLWTATNVALASMSNLAANSIIGNNTGSSATPIALTTAQTTAMLDVFTSSLKGLAPASGGGTTNFLRADGTWAAPGGGGGGITSLNALTGATQTFAVGTSGTDFAISSVGTTHTFNIPDANSTNRGLVTTGTQTFAGAKTFSSAPTFSTMTAGSVLFAGTSGVLTQDNAQLFFNNANDTLGLGTAAPSSKLHVVAGTLAQTTKNYGIHLTATFPTSYTYLPRGMYIELTTAGTQTNTSYPQRGFDVLMNAGYTGPVSTVAVSGANAAAGTAGVIVQGGVPSGNCGFLYTAVANTTGYNYGCAGFARLGNVSIGVVGRVGLDTTTNNKNGAKYIGIVGIARNDTAVNSVSCGGYFGLNTTDPTFVNAALVCDNADATYDIFVARDNGVARWTIQDGGNTAWADGINMRFDTTTGTKIATATSQKIAFWNATPIVQPTTAVASSTKTLGGGVNLTDTDTFDGYTIAQVVKALRNTGLLA
jgi:hypothetical protein